MWGGMFLFKKVIKQFFLPSSFLILLILYGLKNTIQRRKRGPFCIMLGVLIFYSLSITPVTNLLVKPLESTCHPVNNVVENDISVIVVLAGGAKSNNTDPITSSVCCVSLFRILEAVRLYNTMKEPEIYIVGGSGDPFVDLKESVKMKKVMNFLGIPGKAISVDDKSRDTYEAMRAVKNRLEGNRFYLVTSALHMPRSLFLARKLGLKPLPVPCDFHLDEKIGFMSFFPDPRNFTICTRAITEYLGILWYKFAFLVIY